MYVNDGHGKFAAGAFPSALNDQICCVSASAADYDNDGDLDVLLVRGAGERPMRMSLLCNDGTGAFKDVTAVAGLDELMSAASASWGDFDNDGFLDLYVCGEFLTDSTVPGIMLLDPRNRSRLYHNQRDGTFKNVAQAVGVVSDTSELAAGWGDYDDDGRLDLFVTSASGPCRLYHNEGNGHFRDVAEEKGVAGPPGHRWSACFFWDYDNDGRLDLLIGDGDRSLADVAAYYLGRKGIRDCHPRSVSKRR